MRPSARSSTCCSRPTRPRRAGGRVRRKWQFRVHVDHRPLDGTTNFIHGFPQYAVSIALRHRDLITQAVVFDRPATSSSPHRAARRFLNERRIRVSRRDKLATA